jgi:uncharacterized membrane protein
MYSKKPNPNYKGNRRTSYNRSPSHILPSPAILEQYEALIPGSSEKIMDMVDIEQDHRQKWENRALTTYIWSYRIGQLFGLVSIITIVIASLYAVKILANPQIAALIIISGFSLHLVITLLSIKRKKFFEKPRKPYIK